MVASSLDSVHDRESETVEPRSRGFGPAILGAALGAVFYYGIVIGILRTVFTEDRWIGRVMSSWINLGSFIAFGMAMSVLLTRMWRIHLEQNGFALNLLPADENALILPEDALEYRKRLRQLNVGQRSFVLVRLLSAALQRARANWSAQDAGDAVKNLAELVQSQTDSQYSIVRYLVWAIPSIGFIGTVMGVGEAIGTLKGQSSGVQQEALDLAVANLHTAFDTTFVALVLSLVVMWFFYGVQAKEDALLARSAEWCMQRFVFRMHIPQGAAS